MKKHELGRGRGHCPLHWFNHKAETVRFTADVKKNRLFDEDRKMRYYGICAKDKMKKEIQTTQTHPKPSG